MTNHLQPTARRNFLKAAATLTCGIAAFPILPASAAPTHTPPASTHPDPAAASRHPDPSAASAPPANDDNIIGPREGYSPQIGTLVSMMNWLRQGIIRSVTGITPEQLDWLLDSKANTIGALLYHLAAADALYHEHTFKGVEWGKFDPDVTKKFEVAMELGDPARQQIKGHEVKFYLDLLQETRERTLAEFKNRDDKWFMTVDEKWYWGPTNNYCKWFHVCEHESHHLGQIALLKSRVPGAKTANNAG